MKKRGQTTIFIIVAILIVVAGILVWYLFPEVRIALTGELSPNSFLQSCVQPSLIQSVQTLSEQGGYATPEGYILYQGKQIKYLCYNAQHYSPCLVQQPLLKAHFEQELSKMLKAKTEECYLDLKKEYESSGYEVSTLSEIKTNVEIVPEKIRINIDAPMTITKDSTQTFRSFDIDFESKMYDLLLISTSIIDYESTYGDSETTLYIRYYPNLKIEKNKLGDGSTIYEVSDVTTDERFTFATRSLAWPGGYDL